MLLDFKEEKKTLTISFNQQRQKMQNIFYNTLVDENKKPRSGLDFRHTAP